MVGLARARSNVARVSKVQHARTKWRTTLEQCFFKLYSKYRKRDLLLTNLLKNRSTWVNHRYRSPRHSNWLKIYAQDLVTCKLLLQRARTCGAYLQPRLVAKITHVSTATYSRTDCSQPRTRFLRTRCRMCWAEHRALYVSARASDTERCVGGTSSSKSID